MDGGGATARRRDARAPLLVLMTRAEKRRRAWAAIYGRAPRERGAARPYLGVRFDCCGAYSRVYRNRDHTAYEGRCPRCLRMLRIRIDPSGVPARFFRAW